MGVEAMEWLKYNKWKTNYPAVYTNYKEPYVEKINNSGTFTTIQ